MSEIDDLQKTVQELKTQVSVLSKKLTELDSSLTDHTGLDWSETLASIQSPHPNQFIKVASFGKDANGRSTVEISQDGIRLISSTDVQDPEQVDRYITWVDEQNTGGATLSKLGSLYDGNLGSISGEWWVNANSLNGGFIIGSSTDIAEPSASNAEYYLSFVDAFGSGTSGMFFLSRNDASATLRQLIEISPHGSVFSGRIKVGYDALGTDDIIALVLDNADTTSDLPTAASYLRGGLALVEGSPDKIYVCRSPDGGSSYEWVVLGGGVVELVVKGSDQSNSTTTLQDASDMSFAIAANTEVWMKAELYFLDNGGGDVKWDFTVPSGCSGSYWYQTFGASSDELAENSIADTEAISMVTDQTMRVTMHGLINNGANEGTIKLRFACNGASAGNTALQSGSYIQWQVQ